MLNDKDKAKKNVPKSREIFLAFGIFFVSCVLQTQFSSHGSCYASYDEEQSVAV